MIVTSEWERKTFRVKAVRITEGNIREIAEWTRGEHTKPERGGSFVRVPCGAKKENCKAYVGDWVTSLITYNDGTEPEEPNFRVYKQHTFLQAFRQIMSEAEKYAKVHELLMKIRGAQDVATYYGETSEDVLLLIDQTAREICELV